MFSRNLFKEKISMLGFGAMRFPSLEGGEIDIEKVKEMIDYSMANGINYYDTAYIYHGEKSEGALKTALIERYERSKFYVADKIPVWMAKSEKDYEKFLNVQLERLGVDYLDFLLLHSLDNNRIGDVEKFKGFEFLTKAKENGKAKYVGFSFHDNYETFKIILDKHHSEIDFVQLQINYLDWKIIGSDKCYELAKSYNIPVVVMEPVKGGTLANFPDSVLNLFKEADSTKTPASWAIRFPASLDNVYTVLSGMSNMEQTQDNINTLTNFEPYTEKDHELIKNVLLENSKYNTIGCTACDYCINCPVNIHISGVFALYNESKMSEGNSWNSKMVYAQSLPVKADACIECKKCESHCPQNLPIIEHLKTVHKEFS